MKETRQPFFSVIMTFYNSEKFIESAMQSVLDQTFSDYEFVLVDNGSGDSSAQIVSRLQSQRTDLTVRVVTLPENRGIAGGRNAGIEAAVGKYICLIDSDDLWSPDKLEKIHKAIEADETCNCLYHWMEVGNEQKHRLIKRRQVDNKNAFEDLLLNGDPILTSSAVISTELMRSVGGFTESCRYAEDLECWIKLAKKGAKFKLVTESLGLYRVYEQSTSSKQTEYIDEVIKMLKGHIASAQVQEKTRQKYMRDVDALKLYMLFIKENDKRKATAMLWQIVKLRPVWPKLYYRYARKMLLGRA